MVRIPVCVRIEDKELNKIDRIADKSGLTRMEAIREAVRRFINGGGKL